MTEGHVEIELTGTTGRLVLDGHDLTNGIRDFTLSAGASYDLPELAITPLILSGSAMGDQVEVAVELTDEVRRALILAGWTPPTGGGGE